MSSTRHLLGIEGLPRAELEQLLTRAHEYREGRVGGRHLVGRVVANVFYEASTRTRSSFEVAAASLGAHVLNWTVTGSSASKGETLVDTAKNIAALGVSIIVVRHQHSGAAALVARSVGCSVVNAGDGQHEHPSQALLDAYTLWRRWGTLAGKRVAIVGDILHSRVARSNLHCLKALGASLVFCGPPTMLPMGLAALGAEVTTELDHALDGADAVMMLRIQRERQGDALFPTPAEYHVRWGLTNERAAALKPEAVVLHPGPVNRGLELSPEVADGQRSLILEQVQNGVAVRKAILEAVS
ncbi:MAG: aspartate carbamoyltransferase catalytic subunit [Archangium sp.]|nr:aspartate carbamoyltransferase catalytic subunit [Archangium sp.]MDP3156767.1 aspartate carbamoyltransferase catalytic subunit [Archangium sp.]MDP3574615.1 aspartate carbamoyltransferase catalytic subunit [Archangium sp.]